MEAVTPYTCISDGCTNPAEGLYCEGCRTGAAAVTKTRTQKRHRTPERTEAEIRLEIRTWLELHGAFVADMEQNRPTRQTPGVSDLIVCWPGRGVVFLEVKRPTGVQSEAQRGFQAAVEAAGGRYVLARSVEDCERAFNTQHVHTEITRPIVIAP